MASYSLVTSYAGQSLIDGFDFVTITDPTFGFVSYQSYSDAQSAGLVSLDSTTNAVILSVDTTNTFNPDGSQGGRPSVRIESKEKVDQGLVIGDFAHMPGSVCGAWPAFWMYGPNWPIGGEIDIIEGANMAYDNLMSAHTSSGCALPSTGSFTGIQEYPDCSADVGCNYIPPTADTSSYGDDFNGVGGGVYALQWTSEAIQIWHFARGEIPQDIIDQVPDPNSWGAPQALFGTSSCDVDSHFANMSIVVNTDFCGSYAGTLWSGDATCSTFAPTCADYVGNNPLAFTDLYWQINYIDVYGVSVDPAPSEASTTTEDPDTSTTDTSATDTSTTDTSASPTDTSVSTTDPDTDTTTAATTDTSVSTADASIALSISSGTDSQALPVSQAPSVVPAPSVSQAPSVVVPVPSVSQALSVVPVPSAAQSGAIPSGPTQTTVSSSAPSPIDSIVPRHNPATIGGFVYLGCFSSNTAFSTFNQVGTDPAMTLEKCTSACSASKYAGVFSSTCYCADSLDAGTGALPSRDTCNNVCPGNSTEFCGGSTSALRRAAPAGALLTVYLNLRANATVPSPAPALAGSGTAIATTTAAAAGVAASVTTITSTVTYVAVCSTNPAQLVTLTSCITFTACATATTPATVPVTTLTQSCAGCGTNGSSLVTLTIPQAVVITQTSNVTLVGATIKPTSTSVLFPVSAAAPPAQSGMVSNVLMALFTFVGMLLA